MPDYNQVWIISIDFHSSSHNQISRKSFLIHADTRTDMKKPAGAFRDYESAPENYFSVFFPVVSVVWRRQVGSHC
jgi:hypothetical protein